MGGMVGGGTVGLGVGLALALGNAEGISKDMDDGAGLWLGPMEGAGDGGKYVACTSSMPSEGRLLAEKQSIWPLPFVLVAHPYTILVDPPPDRNSSS